MILVCSISLILGFLFLGGLIFAVRWYSRYGLHEIPDEIAWSFWDYKKSWFTYVQLSPIAVPIPTPGFVLQQANPPSNLDAFILPSLFMRESMKRFFPPYPGLGLAASCLSLCLVSFFCFPGLTFWFRWTYEGGYYSKDIYPGSPHWRRVQNLFNKYGDGARFKIMGIQAVVRFFAFNPWTLAVPSVGNLLLNRPPLSCHEGPNLKRIELFVRFAWMSIFLPVFSWSSG